MRSTGMPFLLPCCRQNFHTPLILLSMECKLYTTLQTIQIQLAPINVVLIASKILWLLMKLEMMSFSHTLLLLQLCLLLGCKTLVALMHQERSLNNAHVYAMIRYIQKIALPANLTILVHADSMYSLSAVHSIVKSTFIRNAFVTYYVLLCQKKQK